MLAKKMFATAVAVGLVSGNNVMDGQLYGGAKWKIDIEMSDGTTVEWNSEDNGGGWDSAHVVDQNDDQTTDTELSWEFQFDQDADDDEEDADEVKHTGLLDKVIDAWIARKKVEVKESFWKWLRRYIEL